MISFFVALFTVLGDKRLREFSRKYFTVLSEYTADNKHKPSFVNTFKHVYSYANSLVDKMEIFAGRFNNGDVIFDNDDGKKELFDLINNKKGVFFICNHVGNVDVLRSFLNENVVGEKPEVSVFLQKNHCKIFNAFTEKLLKKNDKLRTYPIEDIDITNAIELDESLSMGGMSFMAGDRVPVNNTNKNDEMILLNKKIELPSGVYRLARVVDAQIYLISCLKEDDKYRVYLEPVQKDLSYKDIQQCMIKFMEEMILKTPHQFYHFCNIFM